MVRSTGLEPVRSPTRPSNVRVCLFRHDRMTWLLYMGRGKMSSPNYVNFLECRGNLVTTQRIHFLLNWRLTERRSTRGCGDVLPLSQIFTVTGSQALNSQHGALRVHVWTAPGMAWAAVWAAAGWGKAATTVEPLPVMNTA